MSKHVVVIGAGVIGLTTALLLQKKGYQVTIVAKYAPGEMNIEYTSPYSGNRESIFQIIGLIQVTYTMQ
jgi:glycine/D-amino acid oxidase-like deaminating enzyme